jgi:hypothetical protein
MTRPLAFDDRMPQWLHVGLVNYIMQAIKPHDCHGDTDLTETFLRVRGVDWLDERGGQCDCEVVLKTHPIIRETVQ